MRGVAPSSRYRRGCWNQRGELPKVLGGGGEVEFIAGAVWPAQSKPVELQDALEVSKQHFDLFALAARDL